MYGRTWDSSPRATHPGTSRLTGTQCFCLFVLFSSKCCKLWLFLSYCFSNLSQQKIIVLADEDNGMKPIVYCDDDVVWENTQLSTGNNIHSLSPFIQPDAVHINLHPAPSPSPMHRVEDTFPCPVDPVCINCHLRHLHAGSAKRLFSLKEIIWNQCFPPWLARLKEAQLMRFFEDWYGIVTGKTKMGQRGWREEMKVGRENERGQRLVENWRKGIVISIATIELENIKLEMLYLLCSSTFLVTSTNVIVMYV